MKITPRKIVNIIKTVGSFYISKIFKTVLHSGFPLSISIEPTTSCNLRCPECPSGLRSFTRPTGMLDEETFKKMIDQLHQYLFYLTFYFQGEPYLHPTFLNMVKYAKSRGIYTSTSTNAHYLSDDNAKRTVLSGLDRLIISIDGTTQEVYEKYRIGGKLEKVIKGASNIIKWRKSLKSSKPYVIFQFLVVKPNEHQIQDVKKLAASIGVDEVKFKTAQIYNPSEDSSLIPIQEKYSRYMQDSTGKWVIKNRLANSCWRMWQSCVITWDGKVVPCCFDKDANVKLGDIRIAPFKTIWKGEDYNGFRKKLINARSEIEMCKNCTEGTKVWA